MISSILKELFGKYRNFFEEKTSGDGAKIHVDEIASKVAAFYEKARNVIDYQEEHLLRKRFIGRVFRRRFLMSPDADIAEPLIKEIIRSGHLPNDSVPESKIEEVEKIIGRLRCLLRFSGTFPEKSRKELSEWLITIAAHAIEENLFPPTRDLFTAELMFFTIKKNLTITGPALAEEFADTQLFIAIQRGLLKVDTNQLHSRLLPFVYRDWNEMRSEDCEVIARELPSVKRKMEVMISHPLSPVFLNLVNRYNTVFSIIGDITEQNKGYDIERGLRDPEALEEDVRIAYKKRFRQEQKKLRRLAILSVISFFLSKVILALLIEVPIEMNVTHSFSLINTAVNIAFPPLLMMLIIGFIRMPSEKNLGLVLGEVEKVVFEDRPKKYAIDIRTKMGAVAQIAVRFFYLLMFFVSLYILSNALLFFHFNFANIAIFVFFVSLVAATGVKVHNRANELNLEVKKATMLSFVFDVFAMPFIAIGRFIIRGLSKFNVLVIALNLVIELPYQVLVEFLENLRGFIKSKKEDVG